MIRALTEKQIGQQIRDDGPASHAVKAGHADHGRRADHPGALLFSTLMMADIANRYVLLALIATVGTGVVGFADDYLKLTRKNSEGLSPRGKTARPILGGARGRRGALLPAPVQHRDRRAVHQDFSFRSGAVLRALRDAGDRVHFERRQFDRWSWTDCAIGPVMVAAGTYAVIAYVTGHLKARRIFADPLRRGRR